jgi:hypothetical protein
MGFVKGPNWKKAWRHQKHFLVHKSEDQDALVFCGRTATDWIKILLFAGTFYGVLIGFWFGCWFMFKAMIITKTGDLPYRTGYVFANERIPNEMAELQALSKKVSEVKPMVGSFASPLDFPMLTSLPRHYDEEDTDTGTVRNSEYIKQLNGFWEKIQRVEHKVSKKKAKNVRDCKEEGFAAARVKDGIDKTVCQLTSYSNITSQCYQNETWGWHMGEKVENFQPCFLLKLNKITGFIPAPMKGERLMKAWKEASENGTSMFIFPAKNTLEAVKNKYGTKDYPWLPVTCWFGLARQGKPIQEGLEKFLGKEFATFYPSAPDSNGTLGHIDLRTFPYMNQENYVQSVLGIKLKFTDQIKPDDVITMEVGIERPY